MSRALVIKNADFSANRFTTVTFETEKPCTGLSFESDSISVTDMDEVEVEYTVTPNDTTDLLLWESSDTDIVTIADGVMTIVGIGSCTITAVCGSYSATATVTVEINVTPEFTWGSTNSASNHAYYTDSSSNFICSGDGSQAIEYNVPKYGSQDDKLYPFIIPKKTAKVRISRSGTGVNLLFYNANRTIGWYKNEFSGDTDAPNSAKYVSASTETVNLCTSASGDFVVPEGVGAFVFVVRCASSYSDTAASAVASNMGLTFEYLPASEST